MATFRRRRLDSEVTADELAGVYIVDGFCRSLNGSWVIPFKAFVNAAGSVLSSEQF